MAKWICYRQTDGHLMMVYVNCMTGAWEKLGRMRRDTPEDLVIDWVVKQAKPAPGDVIKLPSGRTLSILTVLGSA